MAQVDYSNSRPPFSIHQVTMFLVPSSRPDHAVERISPTYGLTHLRVSCFSLSVLILPTSANNW